MTAALAAAVRAYQRHAPARLRARCRFEPSCSDYALAALRRYSLGRAVRMIAGRLLRCRYPNGGVDNP